MDTTLNIFTAPSASPRADATFRGSLGSSPRISFHNFSPFFTIFHFFSPQVVAAQQNREKSALEIFSKIFLSLPAELPRLRTR